MVTLFLVAACLGALYFRSGFVLVLLAIVSAFFYGRTLLLTRPLESIHRSSPLIDAIKAASPNEQRFAVGGRSLAQLPPNQEAMLGLYSVNSYDSLMSRRYRDMTKKWSATGADALSRQFKSLNVDLALNDPEFAFTNVGMILSVAPLDSARLKQTADVGGIKIYQSLTAPIGLLQTARFQKPMSVAATIEASPEREDLPVVRREHGNDFEKIELTDSAEETLLFLSQQYHRAWRAVAAQQDLRTVIVNGFYQGVIVPPHTTEVDLSFRPFVLWSWMPQLLFTAACLFLIGRAGVAHIRRDAAASGA